MVLSLVAAAVAAIIGGIVGVTIGARVQLQRDRARLRGIEMHARTTGTGAAIIELPGLQAAVREFDRKRA